MNRLYVTKAKKGFIVTEDIGAGLQSNQWAFETAETMADFISGWGKGLELLIVKESDIDLDDLKL